MRQNSAINLSLLFHAYMIHHIRYIVNVLTLSF